MIRIPITNPKALALASGTAMTTWSACGYATDVHHLLLVGVSALGGGAVPHNPTSNPSIQADSHIVTPYVNNINTQ
jgi:hypothetical protein